MLGVRDRSSEGKSTARFVSQVIYPLCDISEIKVNSYLVGWNLENFRCTIACIVPVSLTQEADLSSTLNECTATMSGVLASCSRIGSFQPIILGEVLVGPSGDSAPSSAKQARSIWITLGVDNLAESEDADSSSTSSIRKPRLLSLYSLGCRYDTSCYMFGYSPAATSALECFHVDRESSLINISQSDGINRNNHSSRDAGTTSLTSTDLELIVNQMNAAEDVRNRLFFAIAQSKPGNIQILPESIFYTADDPYERFTEQTVHAAVTGLCAIFEKPGHLWCRVLKQSVVSINHKYVLLRLGLGISNWLGITTQSVSEFSVRSAGLSSSGAGGKNNGKPTTGAGGSGPNSTSSQGISWRDLSLSFAYIYERSARTLLALQMCGRFTATWNLPAAFKQYLHTEVMTLVCTTVVDMLLGVVFGIFLYARAEWIVSSLGVVCAQLQDLLIIDTLEWFNHSPVGIKLNPIITYRMGAFLGSVVRDFDAVLLFTAPVHVMIVRLVACMGCHGVSVQLVLVVDFLRLLTFHIATIHRVLSSWHHFMLECLHSLWLLFQGQKNNILRRRIDTCVYDPDQLLFGIVLFSIAFFLFPNFAAYFLLFALAQLGCVMIQYVVYSMSVAVKEFPYFAAALYLFCPGAQTDGVQFKVLDNRAPQTHAVSSQQVAGSSTSVPPAMTHGFAATHSGPGGRMSLSAWLRDSRRGDMKVRSEQPRHPRSEFERREGKPVESDGDMISPSAEKEDTSIGRQEPGLRGILKPASESTAFPPVEMESADPQRARVSFHKGTVRTIATYHSDESSAVSTAESDESVELRDAPTASTDTDIGVRQASLASLRGPTRRQQLTMHNASSATGAAPGALARVEKVAYIELSARILRKTRLFAGYMNHLFYFSYEKGLLFRLVRGVVYGRPALDIQMIHGTCDISDRREVAAKAEMASMLRVMQQTQRDQGGYAARAAAGSQGELSYQEIVGVAMSGRDESVVFSARASLSPSASSGEADALLGASSPERSAVQRYPHSRACRKYSRLTLLALLSTLMLQMVLCLFCSAFFARAFFLEWRRYHPYTSTGVLSRATMAVPAADAGVNYTEQQGPPSCASVDNLRVHTDSLIF